MAQNRGAYSIRYTRRVCRPYIEPFDNTEADDEFAARVLILYDKY